MTSDMVGNVERPAVSEAATGTVQRACTIVERKIGRYVVKVKVTDSNEFVDVVEVGVSTDFRSAQQRVSGRRRLDAGQLDEEDAE